jgi:4-amino-4-deoxy-L-arabinose transferase-like glycosyltransferase
VCASVVNRDLSVICGILYNAARMTRDRLLLIMTAAVALTVFVSPSTRELFVGDETKYAQVVREMRTGSVFLPTLEGTPFTHKPPLHFWMVDALTHVFGVYSTWSFALPSIAGFLALLWLMWRWEGGVAAFICGTSILVWGSAQTARMDVTFTLCIAIAAWMMQRAPDHLIKAGVILGIATLIKGPMAPVIGIFLFVFEWIRRRQRPPGRYALPLLAMIVIPLLWLVPAMLMGGGAYTREVLVKQTAGRAVGAWVHRSPVWFYVAHAPGALFPWFALLVVAIIAAYKRGDERAKFYVSWILAVVVPYSLMSSKLDVYMMAMVPAMALLIARLFAADDVWVRRGHIANIVMLVMLFLAGLSAPWVHVMPVAKVLLIALAIASVIGIVFARRPLGSTFALGLVPIAVFIYAMLFWMPTINELASDRPMVRALIAQRVPAEQIALFTAPHVWTHDMPRELEHVRYVSAPDLRQRPSTLIVTSRSHAKDIADVLRSYRKVAEFQMIGKPFDVYRR